MGMGGNLTSNTKSHPKKPPTDGRFVIKIQIPQRSPAAGSGKIDPALEARLESTRGLLIYNESRSFMANALRKENEEEYDWG
jgi:hypothetical protein